MTSNRAVTFVAVVLGLACLFAGASAGHSFPYCDCVRPKGYNHSPYTLTQSSSHTGSDGSTKVCWGLNTNAYATGPCAKFDLKKIELNINTQCRGAVKSVTFGADVFSPSYTEYTDKGALVFKITRGGHDLATFNSLLGKTTPVCVTFTPQTTCNSLSDFCYDGKCDFAFFSTDMKCCPANYLAPPSPPPPSPRPPSPRPPSPRPPSPRPPPPIPPITVSAFPYCACNTDSVYNSFQLTPDSTSTAGGRNTYCWDLSATRYTGKATKCVNFDLRKIEWDIKSKCQGAVTAITLDGQPIAASYARYARGQTSLKVTHGTSNLATLNSLVVKSQRLCLTLGGACPTLETLCTTPSCRVAYFSPNKKCCPLQDVLY